MLLVRTRPRRSRTTPAGSGTNKLRADSSSPAHPLAGGAANSAEARSSAPSLSALPAPKNAARSGFCATTFSPPAEAQVPRLPEAAASAAAVAAAE